MCLFLCLVKKLQCVILQIVYWYWMWIFGKPQIIFQQYWNDNLCLWHWAAEIKLTLHSFADLFALSFLSLCLSLPLSFSVKAEIKLALRAIADLSALSRAVPHLGPECWPSDGWLLKYPPFRLRLTPTPIFQPLLHPPNFHRPPPAADQFDRSQ